MSLIAEVPCSKLKRESLGGNKGRKRDGCVRGWEVGADGGKEEDGTSRMSE